MLLLWGRTRWWHWKLVLVTHRLHQHIVLAVQQVCPGVLVQRLHVIPCRRCQLVLRHAAAGLPLPDLSEEQKITQNNSYKVGVPLWFLFQPALPCVCLARGGSDLTHPQGRPLGRGVLPSVGPVDSVPLDQLVGRGVCPEVIAGFQLGVLQRARPNCREKKPKGSRPASLLKR